tara:strand:- start:254 stop:646 length:393 start_codon:yes stop_codon:yes gene_type:complete
MADMSNYLENALLNLTLNGSAFTAVDDPYISLHTADPTDAGTGTEVSGTGYARVQAEFATASGTGGSVATTSDTTWAAAGASWGTVGWIGVWDANASGNMLYHTALDAAKTIDTGDVFKITAGNLTVTLA